MKSFQLQTTYKQILADTITPVSVYLKVRDRYPNSILLESSDYHANDNSFSYICFNPIASIKIENERIINEIFQMVQPKIPPLLLNLTFHQRLKLLHLFFVLIKMILNL